MPPGGPESLLAAIRRLDPGRHAAGRRQWAGLPDQAPGEDRRSVPGPTGYEPAAAGGVVQAQRGRRRNCVQHLPEDWTDVAAETDVPVDGAVCVPAGR
jgi:hypothetical protein